MLRTHNNMDETENSNSEAQGSELPLEDRSFVIAADDDRTMRMMLEAQLDSLGYETLMASDGEEAWQLIQQEHEKLDVVLLDREMPGKTGLEVVELMKSTPALSRIPIIMQTGSDKPEQIKQGIDAGVYYYLTKPIDETVLKSVLTAAVSEVRQRKVLGTELEQHKLSFKLITSCKFQFRTLPDAESLACFVANCFADPERVVVGLAELFINALEHGNLNIGYQGKTDLLNDSSWRQEVIRLCELPENNQKFVDVILQREETGTYIRISDQGAGFPWQKYLEIDPARALHNHGRGIAQANSMSFDRIVFNDVGNQVTAFVSNEPELEW